MNQPESFATLAASVGAPGYVRHARLLGWVREVAALTKPERIVWCDGSARRIRSSVRGDGRRRHAAQARPDEAPEQLPRAVGSDRRRTRRGPHVHLQRIAPTMPGRPTTGSRRRKCGARCDGLFDGCMRGRTIYVVPFSMGPLGSPIAHIGVELTDSPYVVVSMRIDDAHGPRGARRARRRRRVRAVRAFGGCAARRRATATSHGPATATTSTSCIFPRRARSGASAPATAAMRCSARNASRCASRR